MSVKQFKCKNCAETLEWPDPYEEGCRPIQCSTRQAHVCQGLKKNSSVKGVLSAKFPYSQIDEIVDKTEELLEEFKKKRKLVEISTNEEAIFFQSIFRSISQNFKP